MNAATHCKTPVTSKKTSLGISYVGGGNSRFMVVDSIPPKNSTSLSVWL
jgi:hypothetical protein